MSTIRQPIPASTGAPPQFQRNAPTGAAQGFQGQLTGNRTGPNNRVPERSLLPDGDSILANNIEVMQTNLSSKPSTRYDSVRGIFGNANDMRASLILNSIEDRVVTLKTLATRRNNLDPQYFSTPIDTYPGCAEIHNSVGNYLGELQTVLVGELNDDAMKAYRTIKSMSTTVSTQEVLTLNQFIQQIVDDVNGRLQYNTNAFEVLLEILNITCGPRVFTPMRATNGSPSFPEFMPGKLALQKFLEATEADNRFKVNPVSADASPVAVVPENVFYRKVGEPDKTYTVNSNGEEAEVQAGSSIYQQLNESNSCYGTGLTGTPDDCNEYFMKCLAGNNVKDCKDYMDSGNYWQNAESAVINMLPDVLLRTLKSFGFQPFQSKNSNGRAYMAYPSAEEWIQGLEVSLGSDAAAKATVTTVRTNSKLMGYLNMIVTKVNSNPGIANPTYVEDGPAYNPNAFAGTLGAKYNIKGKAFLPRKNFARAAPAPSAVSALQNTVVNFMSPLGLTYGIQPFSTAVFGNQRGGAWEVDVSNDKNLPVQVSGHLNNMYESILENLQVGGKDLDSGDQQTIKKMVNELNVLENKLFKSASYVQGYEDLLAINQKGSGVVSESNLEKFVAKRNDYYNRVNSKYDSIFPIFSKLAEACQKETINSSDIITSASYPKA